MFILDTSGLITQGEKSLFPGVIGRGAGRNAPPAAAFSSPTRMHWFSIEQEVLFNLINYVYNDEWSSPTML